MLKVARNALPRLPHTQRRGTSQLPSRASAFQTELQPGLETTSFEIKESKVGEN